jgi:hypothetical protein
MSSDPAPRLATYDDVIALPDNVVGEIIEGELVVSPRPPRRMRSRLRSSVET